MISGIVPVVLTPMTENNCVDVDGLKRLVGFLESFSEIRTLWVLGSSSEDINLTYAERMEVVDVILVESSKEILLGASFYSLNDIVRFMSETNYYYDNIDGYHVMMYNRYVGSDVVEGFYSTLADISPHPVWVYSSAELSAQLCFHAIERLSRHSNIAGIKFSSKDMIDVFRVLGLARDDFQVITAVSEQMYQCLSIGSVAHTTSLASCLPEILIDIFNDFCNGNFRCAKMKQHKVIEFLDCMPSSVKRDNFIMPAEEKYVLELRGICKGHTTSYYRDLTDDEKSIIELAVRNLGRDYVELG
jgi:dihydrodipicolinate synthase/N-acetylneuraminate lyase